MRKEKNKQTFQARSDQDTMRPEYDFSEAVRGVTAERYAQGSNVVILEPDVVQMFPNATAVNEALRALGGIIRSVPRPKAPRKTLNLKT